MKKSEHLSKREQQIMEIIYREGECSAADVHLQLPDPPSYSAVRATLKLMVEKNVLAVRQSGIKYLYKPVVNREKAKKTALNRLLSTFFEGSAESAVATLLDMSKDSMSDEDFDRLSRLIDDAKQNGDSNESV